MCDSPYPKIKIKNKKSVRGREETSIWARPKCLGATYTLNLNLPNCFEILETCVEI